MWGARVARDIVETPKLQAQFGTSEPVEIGALYGSIEDDTARRLTMPRATHPQDHLSSEAIGDAVAWMQRTLQGGRPLPPEDQVWQWKEAGTLLAFLGALVAVLALGDLLLCGGLFAELRQDPPPSAGATGLVWWVSAGLMVALPALTYFDLQTLGGLWLPPSTLFPQQITTGIMVWALGNGGITLAGLAFWHVSSGGLREPRAICYGLRPGSTTLARGLGKALLLGLVLAGLLYALLLASHALFQTDFRFWVVALKPMGELHARIFCRYLVPFAAFFLVTALALHAQLRPRGRGLLVETATNVTLLCGGIVALLLVQYVPLLSGEALPFGEPLLTVVAIQFVPLLAVVAVVSTYLFRRTGCIYTGAVFNALFVTGYIVAGQATHVAI